MKELTKNMSFEEAYDMAHVATLNKYDVSPFSVYHPDVIKNNSAEFPIAWKIFWEELE